MSEELVKFGHMPYILMNIYGLREHMRSFWRLLVAVWNTSSERHVGLIAAGVAFFGMFAIFPGIGAIISLFGLWADPSVVLQELSLLEEVIPPDSYAILNDQIERLLGARSDTLGWASILSIGLATWAARAGVAALMGGLNAIADRPPRNGFKQALVAMTLTTCLILLGITALFSVIVAPLILAFFPVLDANTNILLGIRWIVVFFVLYTALSLLYRYGPNQRGSRLRWFTIGAAVVIIVWIGASVGLSYYLTNFASYNEVYGSIGAVIGMLLWLYVSAYLILLGAALNLHLYGRISGEKAGAY